MARCTLTFEDQDDGTVLVGVDFSPPVDAEQPLTLAMHLAMRIVANIEDE